MSGEKKRSLTDELRDYADGSVAGLERMVRDVRKARSKVPEDVDRALGLAASLMPGYGAYESVQYGNDASRAMDRGNYGEALYRYGQSLDKGADSLMWFIPGMGLIPKVMK